VGDSPWDLDEKLLNFFTGKEMRGGLYVEAGAVNGIWQSNTLLLERNLGWTGLLVEPDHNLYEECLINRPGNFVYNAALVDPDYYISHVEGTFTSSTTNYELALQGQINYKNPDFNIKPGAELRHVPAATLAYILKTLKIKKPIDLLSLDIEGLEIPALSGLDLNINRPRHIIIETTTCEEKREKIYNYLVKFNYRFIEQMTPNDAFYIAAEGKQK
jgi:FkbM family methyltransferase